ncbi:MAG: hypothetical protein MJE66_06650, partial [Proteobacteria bacterium]|nr:hypothetical protein [Pseudomonadota bacterium]
VLDAEALRTGVFRVVSAVELEARGGDPEAWFGLEAEPGYHFGNALQAPSLRPATARGAAGPLLTGPAESVGTVAWGGGLRRGLRIPQMDQVDVAPTAAALLGLRLPDAEGRILIGMLREAPDGSR